MDLQIQLAIHYLCPYSQRALLVSGFKNLSIEIVEVDLSNPSPWFQDLNPSIEAPALKLTLGPKVIKLTQSLDISIYLNSFPGPNLYPLKDNRPDPHAKQIIDSFIRTELKSPGSFLYSVIYVTPKAEDLEEFKKYVRFLETCMESGEFLMKKILGYEKVTMADVMLYPFVERYMAYEGECKGALEDTPGIHQWFERMNEFDWVQRFKISLGRHRKVYEIRSGPGDYQPLALPLSIYDS